MQLVEVNNLEQEKEFLNVVDLIYENYPKYIRPLDVSVKTIFSSKSVFYSKSECKRWILTDASGRTIGRIASFINNVINNELNTLAFGFFECINNQEAANLLFDAVMNWGRQLKVKIIEGPVNYGSTHAFWGLLTKGFNRYPSFDTSYNPEYYISLFNNFNFQVKYKQFSHLIHTDRYILPKRITAIAKRVTSKKDFYIKNLNIRELNKFAKYAVEIYNDAWRDNVNFIPITLDTFKGLLKSVKKVIDEKLILCAFHNCNPVSMVLCIPEPNELIRSFKGKLTLYNRLKFLFNKRSISKARVLALATKERYRNKGLEAALFQTLTSNLYGLKKYKELEISWVGSYNDVMLSILNALGAESSKEHTVFTKLI